MFIAKDQLLFSLRDLLCHSSQISRGDTRLLFILATINLEPHQYTVQKLFNVATRLSKDSGIEHEAPKDPNAEQFSDIDGIDMLTSVIVAGVKKWLGARPSEYLEKQIWSADFMELFQLLMVNNTRILLPNSRSQAVREFEWLIEYKEKNIPQSADPSKEGEIRVPEGIDTDNGTDGLPSKPSRRYKVVPKQEGPVVPTQDDVFVLVMGATGAGKSTFIQYVAEEREDAALGRNLRSYTADIRLIRANLSIDDRPVIFVDTPGFDDTYKSDIEILSLITNWLVKAYKTNLKIESIFYLHRISDGRMAGSPLKNLELFASLCGNIAMPKVTLVTTMWGRVSQDIGSRRENVLKETFWKEMIEKGCKVERFEDSYDSALGIIPSSVENGQTQILISHEIVDKHKMLNQTEAGITLSKQLKKLLKDQKEADNRLKLLVKNPSNRQQVEQEREEVGQQIQQTTEQLQKLSTPGFAMDLFRQFFSQKEAPAIRRE